MNRRYSVGGVGYRSLGQAMPPVNVVPPVITTDTDLLYASSGLWIGSPSTYAYQWKRNGNPISGATHNSYLPLNADVNADINVTVTATNGAGSLSVDSAPLKVISLGSITADSNVWSADSDVITADSI
jgi:hypothetical protein